MHDREKHLLDLLDDGDGFDLLAWVATLERPPVVVGQDGQVLDLDALSLLPAPDTPLSGPDVQEAMLALGVRGLQATGRRIYLARRFAPSVIGRSYGRHRSRNVRRL